MANGSKPIRTPLSQRLNRWRKTPLTFLTWILAIGLVAWMLQGRTSQFEYVGLASALEYEISSSRTGEVNFLLVDLLDEVDKGQIIARLDDSLLKSEIEISKSVITRLQAELAATRTRTLARNVEKMSEWQSDLHEFQIDTDQHRLDALELRVAIESDRIESQRVLLDLQRAEKLLDTNITAKSDYDNQFHLHKQLTRRVVDNTQLLVELKETLKKAEERLHVFQQQSPPDIEVNDLLTPIQASIGEENMKVEMIEQKRKGTFLRAPEKGQVTRILAQAGQTILPGEPVMILTGLDTPKLVGYVAESSGDGLRENMKVEVLREPGGSRVAESIITRIGTSIEELPRKLWRRTDMPEYGRSFVISSVPKLNILPGETIHIQVNGHN
jgi:multidrug resistance efflux pump